MTSSLPGQMPRSEHRAIRADDDHATVARQAVIEGIAHPRTEVCAVLRDQRDAKAAGAILQEGIVCRGRNVQFHRA